MKWKRLGIILLSGIIVGFTFYWGSHMYSLGDSPADDIPGDWDGGEAEEEEREAENPFAVHAFYHEEHLERYEDYQRKMPGLDAETILWQVNAGLDFEPYTLELEAEGEQPLLVNKQHKLPEAYEPELVVIHGSVMATPGTADAFRRMRAAAMADGIYIEAAGGYRSLELQQELFEAEEYYKGTEAAEETVARAGFGEHSTGRALHIVDRNYTFKGFEDMPEYAWLMEHCGEYGFILRYGQDMSHITGFAYEPYHFTFVGEEVALDMQEQGIGTLEEYTARGLAPSGDTPIDDRIAVVLVAGQDGGENTYGEDMARRIQYHLEQEGLRVAVARDEEDIQKESKASALVVIGQGGGTGGAVAWFDAGRPESRSLAETVCSRLCWAGVDAESRGIYEDDKVTLARRSDAPSVFVETSGLAGADGVEQAAKAISDGIIAHLGLRKMYLTFDDGPSAKNTPVVLDILQEKGVKATFFVIGQMAESNPDLLRRIADEGHTIGIHCYNHDYNVLYESVDSFVDDFYRAREAVREITGIEPSIYRFPGGSINTYNKEVYRQIIDEMEGLGFVYYDWNISVDDAVNGVRKGDLMNNVKESQRPQHAVLLMHDAYAYIGEELEAIINYYADYQMDVIDQDTLPVHL